MMNKTMQMTKTATRTLVWMGLLVGMSAVGALIKIPSPFGTVAFDSCPGYFAALAMGGWQGAVVIAAGHLLTSALSGFPMSLPMHLALALVMALLALLFRLVGRKGSVPSLAAAVVLASLGNSFVAALLVLPVGGWALYFAYIPSLLVGGIANTLVAALVYRALRYQL